MTRDSHFDRPALRRAEEQQHNARGKLIRRLVDQHVQRNGLEPTDDYLAMVLGCSVGKVRRHRKAAS
jgi:hypothetical protein